MTAALRRLPAAAIALAGALHFTACGPDSDPGPDYDPMLLTPEALDATAPESFRARFETTKGEFVVEVRREWSPNGADRFYNLVSHGFYDGTRFFRVLDGFIAQFGIHGDTAVAAAWREQRIDDDPVLQSNARGFVSYATGGPNSRTTQLFVNYGNNGNLDGMGFSPFGQVVEGMEVVDQLHSGYGGGPSEGGNGPEQGRIQSFGNDYLKAEFPLLDFVRSATIEEESQEDE